MINLQILCALIQYVIIITAFLYTVSENYYNFFITRSVKKKAKVELSVNRSLTSCHLKIVAVTKKLFYKNCRTESGIYELICYWYQM